MTEEWKPIEGYNGVYLVSSFGNIKRLKSKGCSADRILRPGQHKGYCYVVLYKDGVKKSFVVHRLVAFAFLSPDSPYFGGDVNHLDGVKSNNRKDNLEWTSESLNTRHAYSLGLMSAAKGDSHGNSKLTTEEVVAIKTGLNNKRRNVELAKLYNVSQSLISAIKQKRMWKHI